MLVSINIDEVRKRRDFYEKKMWETEEVTEEGQMMNLALRRSLLYEESLIKKYKEAEAREQEQREAICDSCKIEY